MSAPGTLPLCISLWVSLRALSTSLRTVPDAPCQTPVTLGRLTSSYVLSFAFGFGIFYCSAPVYIYIYFNIFKFSDFCFVLWLLGCEIYFLKISGEHLLRSCWRMPWFAPRPFSMVPWQLVWQVLARLSVPVKYVGDIATIFSVCWNVLEKRNLHRHWVIFLNLEKIKFQHLEYIS